ncbi:hypothetical protein [Kribbella sp. NPDC048928]|uniref:hypothetical protein n=1 Tax=Kribbella sp. NPDC048928 TaxID=3364111 RepID=UPI00371FBC16
MDDLDDDQNNVAPAQAVTPYEWCRRYALDEVDRESLIDVLAAYEYTPAVDDREWNDAIVQPPGTVDEIEQASIDGLIDADLYEAIIDRLRAG